MRRPAGWILVVFLAACGGVTAADDDADDGVADDDGGDDDGGEENMPPSAVELSATTVEEQARPASLVGNLSAVDPDDDAHTFELVDDGGGLFSIRENRLEVAPGAIPNYEVAAQVAVTVSARDGDGASVEQSFDIDIEDLREVVNTLDVGDGSLRQAIADAAPGETILFETGLASRISVNSAIQLNKAVTIRGPLPPAEIVLDANGNNQVFTVSPAANVTLQQLTIRGGFGTGAGAIQNDGRLVVERSILEENRTLAGGSGRGGAIRNSGTLIARDTLFRANIAFNGGAIAADGPGGTLIERCTFQGNQTDGNSGAAIAGALVTVVNSTFAGNLATGADRVGGAIGLFSDSPTANEIAFSTFVDNQATGSGGAIFLGTGVVLTLRGVIATGNVAPVGPDLQMEGTVSGDHNVIGSANGAVLVDGANGNIVGTPITIEAIRNNGGPTPTRLPAAGSPSIDLVPVARCLDRDETPLTEDQRGVARPAGGACDAGAVELE
jgi:predicted outer membrane repeat protein